jgi:uncharacterized protein YjbI with pentapeptide repeats
METIGLNQFLERVKNKQSVSRFDFSISFSWSGDAIASLKKVLANLSEADLSEANLSRANLSEADLSEADLSEANLSRANLSRADLSEADLTEANLSRANLSWADLSWADLTGANLSRANLSRANLSWADLSRANERTQVGFSFSLVCGTSLQTMLKEVKADSMMKEYLQVQALAHASWEDKTRTPFQYMRDYFTAKVSD